MSTLAAPPSTTAAWAVAVGLGALAGVATALSNLLIVSRFPDAARPDDLLFELLPHVWSARWLTVVALLGGFGIFLVDLLRHEGLAGRRLPATGAVLALMYLARAGLNVLTPLAPAHGDGPFVLAQQQFGMFPSGHVAALSVLLLLTPRGRPWVRRAQGVMLALMILGLLLARGHYSIDVIGALLLAYVVVHAWRTWPLLTRLARITG